MKNRIRLLIAALIGVSALAACNSLEVTMPVGPQGEQGIQGVPGKDGLSAYDLWVKAIQEKQIDYSGPVDISHFFIYLKGKDGVDGKDGIDGRDGENGKSAYELWKEYVSTGVSNPHQPDGTNPRLRWLISTGSFPEMMVLMVLYLTSRMAIGGLETGTQALPQEEIKEIKEIRVIKEIREIKVIRARTVLMERTAYPPTNFG